MGRGHIADRITDGVREAAGYMRGLRDSVGNTDHRFPWLLDHSQFQWQRRDANERDNCNVWWHKAQWGIFY